jgi:tRNA (uracil-5-)-methyltransferase
MYDEQSNRINLTTFQVARPIISDLMPKLLNSINNEDELNNKLFQINFRANSSNKVLVTLIYHKKLDEKIKDHAESLSETLKISVILRSKNDIFYTHDALLEDHVKSLNIKLYQSDHSFYQPNHFHMPEMVKKVISFLKEPKDLLELYCGSGTFTLPLSKYFNKVYATENNRQSIRCIEKSLNAMSIENINFSRLSDEEISEAFYGKVFRRMKGIDLNQYNFSHILVDPPRSGLSENVINLTERFKNIIYVSCNYETYLRDINDLNNFKVKNIEIFDQFPNTKHLEIVSLLTQK